MHTVWNDVRFIESVDIRILSISALISIDVHFVTLAIAASHTQCAHHTYRNLSCSTMIANVLACTYKLLTMESASERWISLLTPQLQTTVSSSCRPGFLLAAQCSHCLIGPRSVIKREKKTTRNENLNSDECESDARRK